jgi:hypothetical protein
MEPESIELNIVYDTGDDDWDTTEEEDDWDEWCDDE